MKIEAVFTFRKGTACYTVEKDPAGIYYASLVYYSGEQKLLPAHKIILLKEKKQWTGSGEDTDLINELGKTIEELEHSN